MSEKNIFSDLYDRVIGFFIQQEVSENSKSSAVNRLKTVLAQDRVGFSERAIQMLKDEMLTCISKYMEIDEDSFDLQINPQDESTILELSIPVIRPRTDEEIDKAIDEENERARNKTMEIVEELEGIVKEKMEELTSEPVIESLTPEDKEDESENIDDESDSQTTDIENNVQDIKEDDLEDDKNNEEQAEVKIEDENPSEKETPKAESLKQTSSKK